MSGIFRIDQLAEQHYAGEFVQAIGFGWGVRRYKFECFDPANHVGEETYNVSTNYRGRNLSVEVPGSMTVKTVGPNN